MSKIRDFFYNCSDILVALIILGLAAFLIWTRVNVIMAYPNSYGEAETEIEKTLEPDGDDSQDSDGFISNRDLMTSDDAINSDGSDSENAAGEAADPDGAADGEANAPVTPSSAPTKITIGIPQNSTAEQVGNILYGSGLVSNLDEFLSLVEARQVTEFISGSLSIDSNSSLEQVLDAVTP